MKALFLALSLSVIVTGCGILPKRVEIGQKKIKAVPELSAAAHEAQREAADYIARKTEEAKIAAVETQADVTVVQPVTEANNVAESLSSSLGPPKNEWKAEAEALSRKLDAQRAAFEAKLESYRRKTSEVVGQKIEGTGFIQMGYFTYLAVILGLGLLVWFGLRVWGFINPVVGLGVNTVGRVSSAVVSKGLTQVVGAGERFKDYLDKLALETAQKEQVKEIFRRAHLESQDENVQTLVQKLTENRKV